MPERDPFLSVLIPTHQRREALRRGLQALDRQTAAPESYEVIVSIDGSSDGTEKMLAELPTAYRLRVVERPRSSRAAARNAALQTAGGEIAVILDDDMEAAPELLERHRGHHRAEPRACVLGAVPVKLEAGGTHAARYVATKFDRHLASLDRPDHVFTTRDFYSGNVSLRTEVLREVGGFDPSFSAYGNEDIDLWLRLRDAGVSIAYDAGALAQQTYDKDLSGLARDTFEKGRSTVMLARRHPAAFDSLRLADSGDGSRPWLALRSALLRVTKGRPQTVSSLVAAAALLERGGLWRAPLFYRALLDYCFWAGAGSALLENEDEDELARLAGELRRGPIDLLLHG
jgi:glycosyltransferase involved in cell wall biosynthesis